MLGNEQMIDSLGDRMKLYEAAFKHVLPRRLPVIVRVDGKVFHTYTQSMTDRPFNRKMIHVMEATAIELCREIQGAELAYIQSDEISVLVHGYKKLDSQPWFDGSLQKMVSVAAGIASATFTVNSWKIWQNNDGPSHGSLGIDSFRPAVFDARAFVLPEAEVCNYFVWRQQDAVRNSVQAYAQSVLAHATCTGKSCDELREMCRRSGRDWDALPSTQRNGRCVKRVQGADGRSHWEVDTDIPLFAKDRAYVERRLATEE